MGANGPFGYSQRFNLQMHLDQLLADIDNETRRNSNPLELDDTTDMHNTDLHFYTRKTGVDIEFTFHTDPETHVQTRFLCNSDDELFLFEESFQRVKEEKRVEKIRKEEKLRKKLEEEKKQRQILSLPMKKG